MKRLTIVILFFIGCIQISCSQKSTSSNQWLFETTTGFELENGGTIPFIPMDRFEGVISVKTSGIPTYDE